jgi:dihydroceramide fatty acyl 2-hydroxylase
MLSSFAQDAAECQSPRIFDNWLLDKLSRVHHLTPVFLYLPLVAGLAVSGIIRLPLVIAIAGIAGGYVFWTLVEYWGHRFLFHLRMPGRLGARLHFLIHGVHHDFPNDRWRLVMPPLLSLPILLLGFSVLRLFCGPILVLPVFSGFVAGYLGYDMVHYHLHHALPRTAFGRMLRKRHMLHHFRNETVFFGVSAPWWDHVFRTSAIV